MGLWRWNGESFDGPRALSPHRSSSHVHVVHVHPPFTPEGSYVAYTTGATGYGNVHQAWAPDFESLRQLQQRSVARRMGGRHEEAVGFVMAPAAGRPAGLRPPVGQGLPAGRR